MISGQYVYNYKDEIENTNENNATFVLNESLDAAKDCIALIADISDGAVDDPDDHDHIKFHPRYDAKDLVSMKADIENHLRDCKDRLLRAHSLIEQTHPGFISRVAKFSPRFEECLKNRKMHLG